MENSIETSDTSGLGKPPLRLRRAVPLSSFPRNMSFREQFELALDAGFQGVEAKTVTDEGGVAAIAEAAAATGMVIPNVVNTGSSRYELFSDDSQEVDLAVGSLLTTLDNARIWGAGAIHLIPAYLKGGVPYPEAYRRIQQVIRERILPVAEANGIVCGVENAWNSIVQGPLEYVRFIDEFESPFVKAFLDLGNMILGHAEDWIRLAGDRIVRLHVKDFRLDHSGRFSWRPSGSFAFGRVGDGTADWNAVAAALRDIGYDGWGTCAEFSLPLPTRLLNKACVVASSHPVGRLPGVGWTLARLQTSVMHRTLRDVGDRFDRHLR